MIICYGMAGQNTKGAARLYAEQFPNRRHPTESTITRCLHRLRETGCILPQHRIKEFSSRRRHTVDEKVLREFEDNSGNVRQTAKALGMSRSTVYRILYDNGLHQKQVSSD